MKPIIALVLLLIVGNASGQNLFLESEFADTQFTIKAKALDVVEARMPEFMETALLTELEVLDVYYGDLTVGDTIELTIYSDILKNYYRLALMQGEFLTSFCLSDTGVYFTDVMYPASPKNVESLEHYRMHGTEHWDRHDCAYKVGKTQNPDHLDYEAPSLRYANSQSSIKWRKDKDFMQAFRKAITESEIKPNGNATADLWFSDFSGIGESQNQYLINGDQWLHLTLCELENCQLHNLTVLYNEKAATAYVLINDKQTYFAGNPDAQFKSALLTLHDDNFSKYSVEKRLYNPTYYGKIREQMEQVSKRRSSTSDAVNTLVDIYIKQ